MYCHQCGTQLPDNAHFCINCGADLSSVAGQAVTQPGQQLSLEQAYYQKLAGALAGDGFMMDPRLLEKSDAGRSAKEILNTGTALTEFVIGPFSALLGPLLQGLTSLTATSGEAIYKSLVDVAPLFTIIAAKYKAGHPAILTVCTADAFDLSQIVSRSEALRKALWKLARRRGNVIITNSLYLFFDQRRCHQLNEAIHKSAYKKRVGDNRAAYIWPVVVDVNGKQLLTKKRLMGLNHNWVVEKSAVYSTFF